MSTAHTRAPSRSVAWREGVEAVTGKSQGALTSTTRVRHALGSRAGLVPHGTRAESDS